MKPTRNQLLQLENELAALFLHCGGRDSAGEIWSGRQLRIKIGELDVKLRATRMMLKNAKEKASTEFALGKSAELLNEVRALLPGLEGVEFEGVSLRICKQAMDLHRYPLSRNEHGDGLLTLTHNLK